MNPAQKLLKCFAAETYRLDSTYCIVNVRFSLFVVLHLCCCQLITHTTFLLSCLQADSEHAFYYLVCVLMSAHPLHPTPSSQLDLLSLSVYLSAFQTLLFLNIVGLKSYSHFLKCFLCFQVSQNSLQLGKAKAHLPKFGKIFAFGALLRI